MELGIVMRTYSGYYYVRSYKVEEGRWILGEELECTRRGKLELEVRGILVGDLIKYSRLEDGRGIIEEVLPRKNSLGRPAIANIDQLVITVAAEEPAVNLVLLDRMLVAGEAAGLRVLLCINKVDLITDPFYHELAALYEQAGYRVVQTSALDGQGLEQLRTHLSGQVSAFAGPSGVGKSAILNSLEPLWQLESGELSRGTGRGRHTTRFAQLLVLDPSTIVADTPGFAALKLPRLEKQELGAYFPEIADSEPCRFRSCLHKEEPGCTVKEEGQMAPSRYRSYLTFLEEIEEGERRGKY